MMKNKNGFTMMEVLITMTLITVLASAAIGNSFYTKRSSALIQQKMVALQVIDKRFSEIKKDDGKDSIPDSDATNYRLVPQLRNSSITETVKMLDAANTLKQVTLTVKWDFPWKPLRTITADASGASVYDKSESATTVFYSGSGA